MPGLSSRESNWDWEHFLYNQKIKFCFVDELTPFKSPKFKNIFSFNQSKLTGDQENLRETCERFKTLDEALVHQNEWKCVIVPTVTHLGDIHMLVESLIEKDVQYPYFLTPSDVRVFPFETEEAVESYLYDANRVCPWPTEILYDKSYYDDLWNRLPEVNKLDTLVTVANGLSALHKVAILPNVEKVIFVDISKRQLEWTETVLKNWNGTTPFEDFCYQYFPSKKCPQERIDQWCDLDITSDQWQDAILRCNNATFLNQDVLTYKHSGPAAYYISNAFTYWVRCWDYTVDEHIKQQDKFVKEREMVITAAPWPKGQYVWNDDRTYP